MNEFFYKFQEIVEIPKKMRSIGCIFYIKDEEIKIGKIGSMFKPIFYDRDHAQNGYDGDAIKNLITEYMDVFCECANTVKSYNPHVLTYVIRYDIKKQILEIHKNMIGNRGRKHSYLFTI